MFKDQPLAGKSLGKTNVKHREVIKAPSICVRRWTWHNGAHGRVSHDVGRGTTELTVECHTTLNLQKSNDLETVIKTGDGLTLIQHFEYSKMTSWKITLVNKAFERMWKGTILA